MSDIVIRAVGVAVLLAGMCAIGWWAARDQKKKADLDPESARREAIERADAYRAHPSQGDPFPEVVIAEAQCRTCREVVYRFPTTRVDLDAVIHACRSELLDAYDWHQRTDHGRVAA